MKNLLYPTLFFLCFTSFAAAQIRYEITPNPASGSGTVDEPDVPVDAEIRNLTGDLLQLHWDRTVINLTPGCETAVCDAEVCASRATSSRNFKLQPNFIRPFIVHFYNNSAPCAGIIHVKVTNLNDPLDSVNVVFLFNQQTDVKDLPTANVVLYPNPVTDYFSLDNAEMVATIRMFSIDGREVARFEPNTSNLYSIQNQPVGNYVLALEDKNGHAFQALELKKL